MKIVLMQPYFFPYIGYFTLIKHSDLFVAFDTAQYIRRGWIHRNRILGPDGEPKYINVSIIKAPQDIQIQSVQISETEEWKEKILLSLEAYKNSAPYYEETYELVRGCLSFPTASLSELNIHILEKVSEYLGYERNIKKLSDLNIPFADIQEPDDWGLQLSKACGADNYINASGGQGIYDRKKYAMQGVNLDFYKSLLPVYDQKQPRFQEGLSIIDAMMFNSKEQVNRMIDDFIIL